MDKYERGSDDSQSDISQGILSPYLLDENSSYRSARSEPEEFEEAEEKHEVNQQSGHKLRIDPEESREEVKPEVKYQIYQRPKEKEEHEEEYNPRPAKNRRKPAVKYVKKGEVPVEPMESVEQEEQRPRFRGKERKGRGRRGRGFKQRRQYYDKQNYYERKGNYEKRDNYERRDYEWRENYGNTRYERKDKYEGNETSQWKKSESWDDAEPFVPPKQTSETPKEPINPSSKGKLNIGARPFVKSGKNTATKTEGKNNSLHTNAGSFIPKNNIQPQFIPYGYMMPGTPMMIPAMPYGGYIPQTGCLEFNV
jgi:hypothetical protein